ncbi:MAG: hypothetical protein PWQ35_16 [Patescibacteria group bacterium]|nr:hypothetical protein [Patescibacteria group bacterium]
MSSSPNFSNDFSSNDKESFFKSRRFSFISFLLIFILVISLSIWQLRLKITGPFQAPEGFNTSENNFLLNDNADTDRDGILDYDETFVYRTSPYLEDTDSDGILDNVEIERGTDPICPEGQKCFLSDEFYVEADSSSMIENEETEEVDINMGEINVPTDINEEELKDALAGSISANDLRQLLLSSGADEEFLSQISDEELLASYQEVLNNQQE